MILGFVFSFNSFSQNCEKIKEYYTAKKYRAITYEFDRNTPISIIETSIINSPCVNYYILALEKTKNYNNLYKVADAIATKENIKLSNKKSENNQFPDSIINAISSCFKPSAQVAIGGADLSKISSWFLNKIDLDKNTLSVIYNFYKTNRYELSIFGQHSYLLTKAAKIYISKYGINDPQALEMFDMLNSIYKQSASGDFIPTEVNSQEEYDVAVKKELINKNNYSILYFNTNFNFHNIEYYANRLSYDKNIMTEWYRNSEKIDKIKTDKLDFYFKYFKNNHHYYKAAFLFDLKLNKTPIVGDNYKSYFDVLSRIPAEMFPQANKTFQPTLDKIYELNAANCSFHKDYLGFLSVTKQHEIGIDHIKKVGSKFNGCMNWDSLLLEFRISKIFNSVDLSNDPIKVFCTSIDEKIPFSRTNKNLKAIAPYIHAKTLGALFFTLYEQYPTFRDSIRWGFCNHLFPMSSFNEKELNQFLTIYKKLKMNNMIESVNYDLWNGKTHTEILAAIKSNKITKTAGWQLIAEYGIYYYSESETRNAEATKKTALNLMNQAAAYFPEDGELQKHIGHCLFLLGRSAEAQPYYKRAGALGANMTDVGAYGGTGIRTGPRGGKYIFKVNPGTASSLEP